jgi:hypothetical protein
MGPGLVESRGQHAMAHGGRKPVMHGIPGDVSTPKTRLALFLEVEPMETRPAFGSLIMFRALVTATLLTGLVIFIAVATLRLICSTLLPETSNPT